MKAPITLNHDEFRPGSKAKRYKLGEVWRTTGQVAYLADDTIDMKASQIKKEKIADIYADLKSAALFVTDAMQHAPGSCGLCVYAAPMPGVAIPTKT